MSLTSSLFAGVSGLNAQGVVMGVLGDNIANISTVGFKAGNTTFASLVTGGSGAAGGGSGAIARNRLAIDQQGLIQSTGISTDIAISGQGFFVVKDDPTAGQGEFSYTRAGSFRQDDRGFFVNSSNFTLQAWPLDNNGLLPGEIGNTNTRSNQLLESLESVNTRDISGLAFATTNVSLGLNLNAGQSILTGAGDDAKPPVLSTNNSGVAANGILSPSAFSGLINTDGLTVTLGNTSTFDFVYGGYAESDDITANSIFGAAGSAQKFALSAGAGVDHLAEGDQFTITTVSAGTQTFTFNEFNANADGGRFNSLDTLAAAIDKVPSLTARVTNNRLYISPVDAREAMTFADIGTSTITSLALGEVDTNFANTTITGTNRFNTLQGLANLVNEQSTISASITSAASDSSIRITVNDPLESITFSNTAGNTGNILTEFNLASTTFTPVYNAAGGINGSNMASGDISPAFSRNIRVFDSLGGGHDVRISFVKAGNNKWLVEAFMANPSEIITTSPNGQIAAGVILFNGDGSLANVDTALSSPIQIVWENEAETSTISLNLGTAGSPVGTAGANSIGLTDGLSQFNGAFNVQFAEQNGAGSGLLSSLEIDNEGFIIANFSNGQSRKVFKIPLASFPNANGLTPKAGNVFSASDGSGEFSLAQAGGSGVGVISVAALESANVELADELTKMIVAQRAFQANTKIITTADELLEELNRI